jgi:1-aminocyclopropane-1-carboxylate deaminase
MDIELLDDAVFRGKHITVSILRADKVHPVVSGNKLFKLHYFLHEALQSPHRTLLTFGGAWSNHLVATAFACGQAGLRCIGLVRGEEAQAQPSDTLRQCAELGMELQYLPRAEYAQKTAPGFVQVLEQHWGPHLLVPEGGYHPLGAQGAALMLPADVGGYTHIACSLGTATTVAGLLLAAPPTAQVLGFCALKGMADIDQRLQYLLQRPATPANFLAVPQYSFGGYAKKQPALLDSMNRLWQQHRLPTDFVYTGKLLYGVYDLAAQGFFAAGSRVLCIHTGGLQGNRSLPAGSLAF